MQKSPRVDKEFKSLIPPLTPEEYRQLEQNILSHKCRDPIVLWRGKIIDGHNRFVICTRHGIPYKTVALRFPSRDAAKLWILENQLGRRNLTNAMRIELASRKLKLMGQDTYVRQNIAKEAKVSEKTVERYMQIKARGNQELLDKILSGNIKIGTAHRQADVIITTRESMGTVTQTPEEENFICNRAILNHVSHLDNLYVFLHQNIGYCKTAPADIAAQLDSHHKLLLGLIGRLEEEQG